MDIFSVSLSTYEAYSDSVTYTIEGGLATPTQTSGFLILNFPSSVSMPSSQTITLTIHTLSSSTPHNLQATFTNG